MTDESITCPVCGYENPPEAYRCGGTIDCPEEAIDCGKDLVGIAATDDDDDHTTITRDDPMTEVDTAAIRRDIKAVTETLEVSDVETVINEVATTQDVPPLIVQDQLEDMHRHGFVYYVDEEVRLP